LSDTMILVEIPVEPSPHAPRIDDATRKQQMLEMLKKQMSDYRQQYASMSQDPSITFCDG
jgi:hypothetical protein